MVRHLQYREAEAENVTQSQSDHPNTHPRRHWACHTQPVERHDSQRSECKSGGTQKPVSRTPQLFFLFFKTSHLIWVPYRVPKTSKRLVQLPALNLRRIKLNKHLFVCKAHVHTQNPLLSFERLCDITGAKRAVHTADLNLVFRFY